MDLIVAGTTDRDNDLHPLNPSAVLTLPIRMSRRVIDRHLKKSKPFTIIPDGILGIYEGHGLARIKFRWAVIIRFLDW